MITGQVFTIGCSLTPNAPADIPEGLMYLPYTVYGQ